MGVILSIYDTREPILQDVTASGHMDYSCLLQRTLSGWILAEHLIGIKWGRMQSWRVVRFFKGNQTLDMNRSSWWLRHPFEKHAQVKMGIISPNRGENKQIFKKPPPKDCILAWLVNMPHQKKNRKSQVYPKNGQSQKKILLQEKDLSKSVMILEGKKTVPETKSDWSRRAAPIVWWTVKPWTDWTVQKGKIWQYQQFICSSWYATARYMSLNFHDSYWSRSLKRRSDQHSHPIGGLISILYHWQ